MGKSTLRSVGGVEVSIVLCKCVILHFLALHPNPQDDIFTEAVMDF